MEDKEKKREEAIKEMKMYMANDWQLKEETPEFFLLKRNEASTLIHIVLAILFWWLLFIPNLIYHFMSVKTRKILK